jgi:hypothetical protein
MGSPRTSHPARSARIFSVTAEHEPRAIGPTVEDIASQGGWTIEDPQVRHDRNPDAFWLPGDDLRAAIGPGSQVRLLLWFVDESGPEHLVPQCERMWALVETREGDVIGGRLTSPPLSAHATLEMGELLQFRAADAIDVLKPEDDWEEHRSFLQAMFDGDQAFEEWKRAHPHRLEPRT